MCGFGAAAALDCMNSPSSLRRSLIAGSAILIVTVSALAQGPTWSSPSVVPEGRSRHAMAYDAARGRTVLFGGWRTGVGNLGDTWEWDGSGWIRHTPAQSPPARSFHMMAFDQARGVTVLFGGIGTSFFNDTWEWNGSNWQQVITAHSPPTLEGSAMAYHAGTNPGVLLFGGLGGFGYINDTWRYDGVDWTWLTGVGPSGRRGHAMCYASLTQHTYLYGGVDTFGIKQDLWAWNGLGWNQTAPAPGYPVWLAYHSMTYDEERHELVIVGGSETLTGGPWGKTHNLTFWGLLAAVTPAQWFGVGNWDNVLSRFVPPGRVHLATVYDAARRRVVSFGGLEVDSLGVVGQDSGMLYEVPPGGSNPFSAPWLERTRVGGSFSNPVPQPRIYTEMAFDQGLGRSVLYGGWNGSSALGDTWSWNGTKWTDHGTAGTAGPRVQPALCWTPWLGVVMFGGAAAIGGPYFGDTMAWTGTDWLATFTLGSPTPRYGHDMVLDTARNRVVMFGGYGIGGAINTTHELVQQPPFSQQWFQIATNGTPPARNAHRLAYDQRRQRTVLFGGADAAGVFLGDTWEYDGMTATWTQVFPAVSPPRRWNHVMDYDPTRGVIVLTGGYGNPLCGNFCASHLNDVWEYDGSTWKQRFTGTTLPSGREGAAFAYDTAHNRFVMQGGSGSIVYPTETWLYNAPVDRFALGMASVNTAVRCKTFPIAGKNVEFEFPSPSGFGWLAVAAQPMPGPGLTLGPGLFCDTGTAYPVGGFLVEAHGTPGHTTLLMPLDMANQGFCCQGVSLGLATLCLNLTDPLAVTIHAP